MLGYQYSVKILSSSHPVYNLILYSEDELAIRISKKLAAWQHGSSIQIGNNLPPISRSTTTTQDCGSGSVRNRIHTDSVVDPDPSVFGPSGSIIILYGSGWHLEGHCRVEQDTDTGTESGSVSQWCVSGPSQIIPKCHRFTTPLADKEHVNTAAN